LHNGNVSWIRRPEYFTSINSTNDHLLAGPDSVHGRLCIADFQTRGKGRLGKQWYGSAGTNLMFSLGWQPRRQVASEVSLVASLALASALDSLGVEGVELKWPNDVLVHGAKLAGILIESRTRGRHTEFVLGIGLNIQHQPADLKDVDRPWTDLMQQGMRRVDRQAVLIEILYSLSCRLQQLESRGFGTMREDWLSYHAYQGTQMNYQYQGQTCVGRVVGLDHSGALIFETEGRRVAVRSGEVSSLRVEA